MADPAVTKRPDFFFTTGIVPRLRRWLLSGAMALLCCTTACEKQDSAIPDVLLPSSRTFLLIGDSLTERSDGFYLESLSPDPITVYVRGVDGYDYRDWSLRMGQAFSGVPPVDRIVTVLGTNDGARFSGSEFLGYVRDFQGRIRQYSSAPIVFSQVPRTQYSPVQSGILANNALLAGEVDPNSIVDLDTPFESHRNAGGTPLYNGDDAIHPNVNGYRFIGTLLLEKMATY